MTKFIETNNETFLKGIVEIFFCKVFCQLNFLKNGTDETRTRNFRRDRAVL
jgi:hypothetical protein